MSELKSKIAEKLDLQEIAYSMLWEDSRILNLALKINPDDHVLSICSAGCNVLSMLLAKPKAITAIDFNQSQLMILELKIAGIKRLDHAEFMKLLGFYPCDDRIKLFDCCASELPPSALSWWQQHQKLMIDGIAYSGRLELYLKRLRENFLRIWKAEGLAVLKSCQNIEEQARFWQRYGTDEVKHMLTDFVAKQNQQSGRDAAKLEHVHDNYAEGLWQRLEHTIKTQPMSDNFFNQYILLDDHQQPEHTYDYLNQNNFTELKSLVNRITLVHDQLEKHLTSVPIGTYSKGNFSDIFEYMTEDATKELLSLIGKSFAKSGRIAYWNLFVDRNSRNQISSLSLLQEESQNLHLDDRLWFYKNFFIETII
ncbi:MAG: DUF3419 family protein [Pseudobacteriovorax sp.]|nr:DUF3419 family protein [Pseudobacteriovorax sp.]